MDLDNVRESSGPEERRIDMNRLVTEIALMDAKLRQLEETFAHHTIVQLEYQDSVKELVTLLTQTKGILKVTRAIVYFGAPLAALLLWLREHIKW